MIFLSCLTLKFNGWHWKTKGHLFYTTLSFVHHFKAMGEFKLELQFGNTQFGSKSAFFVSCDLEIWQMTMKNYRAPLLCCFRLCASFHSHWWIKTGVTVWKHPILVKINNSFYQVTLKFDRWPWKTIGHLSYAASGFVHHFIAIGELKLELQSGNTQFWSKSTILFTKWPWNLTDDLENRKWQDYVYIQCEYKSTKQKMIEHLFLATSNFVYHFITIRESYLELQSRHGQIVFWPVTLTFDLWPWPFSWTSLLSLQ